MAAFASSPASQLPAFEYLLAGLIETFTDAAASQLETRLRSALRHMLNYFGFKYASFMALTTGGGLEVVCTVAAGAGDQRPLTLPDQWQWCLGRLREGGGAIAIRRLPDDALLEPVAGRLYVRCTGVRTHLLVPIASGGKVLGAVWFAAVNRDACAAQFKLKLAGEILALAIAKDQAESGSSDIRCALPLALSTVRPLPHGAQQPPQTVLARVNRLSSREREVMACVVDGLMNKQIAVRLGIAEATVKQHRARVMEKMQAHSIAELVRLNAAVALV